MGVPNVKVSASTETTEEIETIDQTINQVNHYLSDRNITKTAKSIVGSSGYGDKGGHWVVGTGYWTVKITANNASTTARYVQMNDGWGNTGVYINLLHVNGIIYIE